MEMYNHDMSLDVERMNPEFLRRKSNSPELARENYSERSERD